VGHKFNPSPSYSVKAMNEWSCTSDPPISLHGVDSENFSFTLHKVCIKSAVFKSIVHCIHVVITDGCCSECDSYIRFVLLGTFSMISPVCAMAQAVNHWPFTMEVWVQS